MFIFTVLDLAPFLYDHNFLWLCLFHRSSSGLSLTLHLLFVPSAQVCTGFLLLLILGHLSLGVLNFTFTSVHSSFIKLASLKHFEDHLFPAGNLTDMLSIQIYKSVSFMCLEYTRRDINGVRLGKKLTVY